MPKLADHINSAAVQLDLWIPTADYTALQLELLDLRIPT